jgi:nucleotide-binding universal stress UspA family protein
MFVTRCGRDMPKQPMLVLVTAEMSRNPDPAIVSGARLSALTRSALHVLHCVPTGASADVIRATGESLQQQTPTGTTVTVVSGTPHEEIAAEAARAAADIVVLGPRPDPAAAGRLGRTAHRVLRATRFHVSSRTPSFRKTPPGSCWPWTGLIRGKAHYAPASAW